MKVKQVIVTAFVLWLLVVYAAATHAQTPPSIPIGPGLTEDKPQSKLWYTDNAYGTVTWWGILGFVGDTNAAPGVYFYKLENGVLVRQTFPGAHLVGVDIDARADVLWNGTDLHLFVLMYKGEDTTLFKYSYDASTQTYTLLAGFPVAIPLLAGSESATITQDSTGKLWIAYDPRLTVSPPPSPPPCPFQAPNQLGRLNEIHALGSVDHTTWDVMNNRVVLQSPVCDDDLAALVAVSFKDRIGVMWSDQTGTGAEARDNFGFRFRWDANPDPTSWSPVEIVPMPPSPLIADDHIHLTVTEHGDILAATKSSTVATDANGNPILDEEGEPIALNEINLFVRWHDGKPANPWDGPYFVTGNASRPIVVFDKVSKDVYVFYTGAFDFPLPEHRNISYKVAKLWKLADLATNPEHVLIEVPFPDPPGSCDPNELDPLSPAFCPQYSVNNATSTKQAVDVSKGLLVVAKDEREDEEHAPELSRAYYNLLTTEKLRKERKEAKSSRPTYSSRR
jgi:hypothetical protein